MSLLDRFTPPVLPEVAPMPPVAGGRLPWLGAAPGLLRDPTAGHGSHLCPAQRFSITAIHTAVRRLDLTAEFSMPGPLTRQIGGVARADRPTPVRYR